MSRRRSNRFIGVALGGGLISLAGFSGALFMAADAIGGLAVDLFVFGIVATLWGSALYFINEVIE